MERAALACNSADEALLKSRPAGPADRSRALGSLDSMGASGRDFQFRRRGSNPDQNVV